jgi:hypothetical protein
MMPYQEIRLGDSELIYQQFVKVSKKLRALEAKIQLLEVMLRKL